MPTIADLFGIDGLTVYGKSFLHEALGKLAKSRRPRCAVSVQPFGGRKISIIQYPMKRIYDVARQQVALYDLEKDPNETAPLKIVSIDTLELGELQNCVASLSPNDKTVRASR
jgi:hypothetical protein